MTCNGLARFVGLCVFVYIYPTSGYERINFHDSTSKGPWNLVSDSKYDRFRSPFLKLILGV